MKLKSFLTVSRNARAVVMGAIAIAGCMGQVQAQLITVPNASFESQVAGPPFGVNNNIDSWQKAPQPAYFDPAAYGFTWDQTAGVFANTPPASADHIDNMDGNQALYFLAFPGVGVFQDYNSTDWNHTTPTHGFNSLFEVGKSYTLTVGLFGKGGMPDGDLLDLSLYYRDAANNMVTVAMTPVTYTSAAFPSSTHFIDFQVNVPAVQAGDAWAGKNIGIQLLSAYGTGPGYWDIDNVRLTSAVPEPASLGLVALGFGGLILARRRAKRGVSCPSR